MKKEFTNYVPTLEALQKGLSVARAVDADRFIALYTTCYLADHREKYKNVTELYEMLYDEALEYAFYKKIGKIKMSETENTFRRKNDLFNTIISETARHLNLAKYHGQQELK